MNKIWKYLIHPGAINTYKIPANAVVRSVGKDYDTGSPAIWLEIDQSGLMEERSFLVVATGEDVPPGVDYRGTVHGIQGWMVFHIFEKLRF